jgi:hypothetical protein
MIALPDLRHDESQPPNRRNPICIAGLPERYAVTFCATDNV